MLQTGSHSALWATSPQQTPTLEAVCRSLDLLPHMDRRPLHPEANPRRFREHLLPAKVGACLGRLHGDFESSGWHKTPWVSSSAIPGGLQRSPRGPRERGNSHQTPSSGSVWAVLSAPSQDRPASIQPSLDTQAHHSPHKPSSSSYMEKRRTKFPQRTCYRE